MEQGRKLRNKPMHLWSINLWQNRQDCTMLERQSLQQMVLGKLDSHMWKMKLYSLSNSTMSAFSQLALSSVTPFTFDSNLTFSLVMFHFSATLSSFFGQFPLSIIHFYKMSHGLITGRQEANTITYSAVGMNWWRDEQWSITNSLWKGRCDWSLIMKRILY